MTDPQPPRWSHRVWAILLFLDAIFVILFAGAAATKVYEHWKTPAAAVPVGRRRPAPKPAEPTKPAEPAAVVAAAPVKPVEPPKPPEPVKPAPKPEPIKTAAHHAETGPRPPKPSLLNDAPKPRATPTLSGGFTAPAAPAPAADVKSKAQAVVFKVRAPNARAVQLVGAFIVRGGRKEMVKDGDGFWSVKLYLNPGQYRYFFAVDKKKTLDPENPQSDRGASLLSVP